MAYTISGQAKDGAKAFSQPADDIEGALMKAWQMLNIRLLNVSIRDNNNPNPDTKITGDDLLRMLGMAA